jgi:hypothetical protein
MERDTGTCGQDVLPYGKEISLCEKSGLLLSLWEQETARDQFY